jgi:predicted nucleic-acid-binding protein
MIELVTLKMNRDYVEKYIDTLKNERMINRNDVLREALFYYRKNILKIDE